MADLEKKIKGLSVCTDVAHAFCFCITNFLACLFVCSAEASGLENKQKRKKLQRKFKELEARVRLR